MKLNEIDVEDFLARCVQIEPMMLEEEFVSLPSQMAYWNERYAQANRTYLQAKIKREGTFARVRLELKAKAEMTSQEAADDKAEDKKKAAKPKGPTVDDLKAMTDQNPEVRAAVEHELMSEVEYDRLRGVMEALRAKREMLVSLGAHLRAEMAVNPNMREEVRSRHFQE